MKVEKEEKGEKKEKREKNLEVLRGEQTRLERRARR